MTEHAEPHASARGLLHVIHGHGGGTEHHVLALIGASRAECRHYLATAVGDRWRIDEQLQDGTARTFQFHRGNSEGWPEFIGGICATFGIDLVHLHNISGSREGIVAALPVLGVPYGYTVHDLNFACPTILFLGVDGNYCGEVTDPRACQACLDAQPAFAQIDIVDWRARHRSLVANAVFLVAPSRWAASALERYYPEHRVTVIAHAAPAPDALPPDPESDPMPLATPREGVALPDDGAPTIAILGAVGPDKGARRIERLVELARVAGTRVRFVLIGYMDVQHGPWQSEDALLTVHGRYHPCDLPHLLAHYRVRLVAFPSAGPETFSFTLSEAWRAGYPVIVPPFGALAERVGTTNAGWLWTDAEWRDEASMLARMIALLEPEHATALTAAVARGRAVAQQTPAEMAAQTLRVYPAALPASNPFAPFASARVREAQGGDATSQSSPEAALSPSPSTGGAAPRLFARIAATLTRLRSTRPGRALKRTPRRARKPFKTR